MREVELKFAVTPKQVDTLRAVGHVGPFVLGAPELRVIQDTYVDSPDFALLRRGFTLRVRRQPHAGSIILLVALKSVVETSGTQPLDRLELEEAIRVGAGADASNDTNDDAVDGADDDAAHLPGTQDVRPLQIAPDELPQPIADYLGAQGALPTVLTPYLVLQQRKEKRIGRDGRGTAHVELSLDAVTVHPVGTLRSARPALAPNEPFLEMEIEALSGKGEQLLDALAAGESPKGNRHRAEAGMALEVAQLVRLNHGKVARALLLWAGIGQPGVPRGMPFAADAPVAVALRSLWRQTLVQLLLLEPAVRADVDIEAIHQMRVALRRARTAARFLRQGMKPKRRARLLAGMQRLAQRLGAVRDLDVALLSMGSASVNSAANADAADAQARPPDMPADDGSGRDEPPADTLADDVLRQRTRALARLQKWLNSPRHAAWVVQLVRFCGEEDAQDAADTLAVAADTSDASGDMKKQARRKGKKGRKADRKVRADSAQPPGELPIPTEMRHVLPGILINQLNRIRVFERNAEAVADLPGATLHALRIECKRLRYIVEFSQHLLGASMTRFVARVRRLQEALGSLNDAYVELARLGDPDSHAESRRVKALHRKIKRMRRRLPARLEAVIAPKSRRQFVIAVAEL